MRVSQLIELLSSLDPDAKVYIMSQPNYPFEVALSGVAVREDFTDCGDDDDEAGGDAEETLARYDRWSAPAWALPKNDVFLLDGGQLRYGSQAAWDNKL